MAMPVTESLHYGAPLTAARALCVFLHGRGQTPEEMLGFALSRITASDVAFVLPSAAGKSWYKARAIDPLTPETEEELAASMVQVAALARAMQAERPDLPLVLAGFSQGACLALELTLRGQIAPQALVALTGCRLGTPACNRPARALHHLPTYLTGSDNDPWIPVHAFADAAGQLAENGAWLTAESHPGRPHEVSDAEAAELARRLATFTKAPPP